MWEALQAAKTLQELQALSLDWLDAVSEETDADILRDDLQDHIREVCYSTGVHCEDVFGDDA